MEGTKEAPGTSKKKAVCQKFQFGPWTISSCKSHILESEGPHRDRYDTELELPQLPEMVFPENYLHVSHESGCALEFSALDALRRVDAHHTDLVKVAASREWQGARTDCEHIKNVVSPFDWTYTTDYRGTFLSEKSKEFKVTPTTERIDLDKLRRRDPIHFFDEILLFEDELSDNGTSMLSLKVRVMPTCFFVLMRFFVRVDQVLIRINDTRLFHEAGTDYILREYSSKEAKTSEVPISLHTNPNEVSEHLKLTTEIIDKLEFS